MISVYNIKPKFQKLLSPVLAGLHKNGVTPNQVTISAILLSACMGVAFYFAQVHPILYLAVAAGLLFRMALNAIDGMLATKYDLRSSSGELLNEFGDVISDLFLFIPLLFQDGAHSLVVICFVALAVVNEFSGLLAKVVYGSRRYDGPMGKSDRALVIGLLAIAYYMWEDMAAYVNYVLLVCCLLMLVSTYARLKKRA